MYVGIGMMIDGDEIIHECSQKVRWLDAKLGYNDDEKVRKKRDSHRVAR